MLLFGNITLFTFQTSSRPSTAGERDSGQAPVWACRLASLRRKLDNRKRQTASRNRMANYAKRQAFMARPGKDRRLRIAAANGATTPPAGLVRRLDVHCPRNCHAVYYIYTTSSCQEKNGLIMEVFLAGKLRPVACFRGSGNGAMLPRCCCLRKHVLAVSSYFFCRFHVI
jgi:hypothetical protein